MDISSLRTLLEQDLDNARRLSRLLLDERHLLEQRDVRELDRLLGDKATLLARMEKHDGLRRGQLEQAGYDADRSGLQACCRDLDQQHGGALDGLCQTLFTELAHCREATAVNANIVHRSRHNNARLLELIRGGTGHPDLYGPGGTAGARPENRTLGNA